MVRSHAWPIAIWAAMLVWTVVLFAIARGAYLNFRLGRFDLGNMVQAVWSTTQGRAARDDGRLDGRTGRAPRRPRRSAARAAGTALDRLAVAARARVRADRGRGARSASGLLARSAAPRRRSGWRGVLALAYLAYPWVATSAVGAIHPVTFAITFLLFAVWFLDSDRLVPFGDLRGAGDVDGRADGAADSAASVSGTRSRAAGEWPALSSRSPVSSGRSSPSTSSSARSGATEACTTASTTRSEARRRESLRMLFTDPGAVLGALVRDARHRLRDLARAAAPLPLPALARARGRRAPAAARERALGLPLDVGPAVSQRRCGDPVPHRSHGRRDRSASGRAAPACGRRCSRLLPHVDGRARPVGAARRRDAARWSRVRPVRSRGGSERGGRARSARCAGHRRPTPPGATSLRGGTSTACRSSAGRSGSWSTEPIRGS